MASIPSSIGLTGPIAPFDSQDTYATHFSRYGHGGFYSVSSEVDLAAIPTSRLGNGEPLIYSRLEEKWFLYLNGVWVDITPQSCCVVVGKDGDDDVVEMMCTNPAIVATFGFDNSTFIDNGTLT